eukprot:813399-Pyramimonas_sp.AAC.1
MRPPRRPGGACLKPPIPRTSARPPWGASWTCPGPPGLPGEAPGMFLGGPPWSSTKSPPMPLRKLGQ